APVPHERGSLTFSSGKSPFGGGRRLTFRPGAGKRGRTGHGTGRIAGRFRPLGRLELPQMRGALRTAVIILGHFRRIALLGRFWSLPTGPKGHSMKTYVTVGLTVLAGAALLETALIPGILIGGVAVLAPRYLPKGALPSLRRRMETLAGKTIQQRTASDASRREQPQASAPQSIVPKFAIGQAVAKTITFR